MGRVGQHVSDAWTMSAAIDWALDQKIIPKRLSVDELFDDITGSLG